MFLAEYKKDAVKHTNVRQHYHNEVKVLREVEHVVLHISRLRDELLVQTDAVAEDLRRWMRKEEQIRKHIHHWQQAIQYVVRDGDHKKGQDCFRMIEQCEHQLQHVLRMREIQASFQEFLRTQTNELTRICLYFTHLTTYFAGEHDDHMMRRNTSSVQLRRALRTLIHGIRTLQTQGMSYGTGYDIYRRESYHEIHQMAVTMLNGYQVLQAHLSEKQAFLEDLRARVFSESPRHRKKNR